MPTQLHADLNKGEGTYRPGIRSIPPSPPMPGFVLAVAKGGGVSLAGLNGSGRLLDPKPIDQKMKGVIPPMKTQISIDHWGCNRLIRLLALILALALATPVLLAQKSDSLTGRDKHDPTGAWLLRTPFTDPAGNPQFTLTVFNRDGTFTQNNQGGSAFDPAATTDPDPENLFNIITSPQSGVWQKTGQNTFAATFLAIEYRVRVPAPPSPLPGSPLFRFDKVQYTGTLNQAGDSMEISAVFTFFDEQGNQLEPKGGTDPVTITGVRIPLTILPSIPHSLPTPPPLPQVLK
jgi:hypothetical protein